MVSGLRYTKAVQWAVLLAVPWLAAGRLRAQGDAVEITRGPYLQALLGTSVEVIWRTSAPCTGKVVYGEAGGGEPREAISPDGPEGLEHRVKLAALSPGASYTYEIHGDGRVLKTGCSFRTSPGPQGTIRVAVTGDGGTGREDERTVAAVVRDFAPDLFLLTGDIVRVGDVDLAIFVPYREILTDACLCPAVGNHDFTFSPLEIFVPPSDVEGHSGFYYSWDWGPAHFAALDTNTSFAQDGPQVQWLISDLEAARDSDRVWTILYFHEPAFTVGAYSRFPSPSREVIPPIADRFGVDLVIAGHDHNYQRSHPVRGYVVHDAWQDPEFVSPRGAIYLVTGGGGATLYPRVGGPDEAYTRVFESAFHAVTLEISPREIRVEAVTPDHTVLDSFRIMKGGVRPPFRFLRGDADGNGNVELTDAVRLLHYLFLGGPLECPAAADMKGEAGVLNITDPIYVLNHLFLGGPPPASPFPACGEAPGADDAWCTRTGCLP